MPLDPFGVPMIYRTKDNGQEWYINMQNPIGDTHLLLGDDNTASNITVTSDGALQTNSNTRVRLYASTTAGYATAGLVTSQKDLDPNNPKGQKRGYMMTPSDWTNVEITVFFKLGAGFDQSDNNSTIDLFARGGRHGKSGSCEGTAMRHQIFLSDTKGTMRTVKEQYHKQYAPGTEVLRYNAPGDFPLAGNWIGMKLVVLNKAESPDAKGNQKVSVEGKYFESTGGFAASPFVELASFHDKEAGGWGKSGSHCNGASDNIIDWGGPLCGISWDNAPEGTQFKWMSVREIEPTAATGEQGDTACSSGRLCKSIRLNIRIASFLTPNCEGVTPAAPLGAPPQSDTVPGPGQQGYITNLYKFWWNIG